MTDLKPLEDEVSALTQVVPSVIALMEGFAAKVEAEKEDPVRVQGIIDSFRAQNQVLAAAVVAHTPAA